MGWEYGTCGKCPYNGEKGSICHSMPETPEDLSILLYPIGQPRDLNTLQHSEPLFILCIFHIPVPNTPPQSVRVHSYLPHIVARRHASSTPSALQFVHMMTGDDALSTLGSLGSSGSLSMGLGPQLNRISLDGVNKERSKALTHGVIHDVGAVRDVAEVAPP